MRQEIGTNSTNLWFGQCILIVLCINQVKHSAIHWATIIATLFAAATAVFVTRTAWIFERAMSTNIAHVSTETTRALPVEVGH